MATSGPTNLPAFLSGDADFRTWGSGVKTALAACGLVQTGDTGQINWTTVTRPAAINTVAGYEVWRFADSLQGANPVYIKIEYGTGGAVDRPSIWITVGTATNGAGTLQGQVGARTQAAPTGSYTAGAQWPLYACGAQGSQDARISLFMEIDSAQTGRAFGFHIERLLDNTGVPTSDGVYTLLWTGGSAVTSQLVPTAGAVPSVTSYAHSINVAPQDGTTRATWSGNVAMSPIFAVQGYLSAQKLFAYRTADVPGIGSATVNVYGANHTVMLLGPAVNGNNLEHGGLFSQNIGEGVAIMWE